MSRCGRNSGARPSQQWFRPPPHGRAGTTAVPLGLAPIIVEELATTLEQLRRDGIGVLLVEQEYPLALRLADSVYVLQKGRVRFEGSPEAARDVLMSSYLGHQAVGGRSGG